ncbi:Ketosteroid isomerase homolog [Bryocella elongata]|uniref:Ketosteroid isomerase homolog n=1 Tax=Bryocella elongata TaxID=863522 RepID=A0A1H5Y8A9_9BACT|nr:DUF4440 domain-containing protein [Bryocella elongata]SEG20204.1 Ketosteroid isomerase homolog [Bryocella elongata]
MNGRLPQRFASVMLPGLAVYALALLSSGCNKPASVASPDHSADLVRLTQMDADWVKAAQTHSVDAWMAFYAPNAVVLPPNEKTADTPAEIRAAIGELMATKDLAIDWKATKTVVSDAGDMAWIYGTYTLEGKDAAGVPISDNGKMAEVWQKQGDGAWKCVLDTWSSDLPVLVPDKK